MSHSHLHEALAALASRLKAAVVGFGITVAPVVVVALAQYALMPQIVGGALEGRPQHEQAESIISSRSAWLLTHVIAAALFAIYWLTAALFGKGQLLRLRAANKTLTLSVLAYLVLSPYYAFFPWSHDLYGAFRGACPIIGISDGDPNPYATGTNCGAFFDAAHTQIILGLLGLSVVLLVVSLIVRIVSSRLESWG